MNILFSEPTHSYFLEGTDFHFTSVSKFIEGFSPKFDFVNESIKYAQKHGLEVEDVRDKWYLKRDVAIERGKAYHSYRENEMIAQGANVHVMKGNDKVAFSVEDMKNLKPGIYVEMILYFLPAWLIGQSDQIEIFEDKTFDLLDFKTNESLDVVPKKWFKKEKGYSDYEYMKFPLDKLPATKFNKYQLQLSIYSYFLEFYGYKARNLTIEHILFHDDNTVKDIVKYPVTYMKAEVEKMIKFYQSK